MNPSGSRRAALLTAGGTILRRKRRMRVARSITGVALAIGAVILLSWYLGPLHSSTRAQLAKNAHDDSARTIRVLNDDELLAMFPGTPVGIATVNGKKRLIFPRSQDEQQYVIHINVSDPVL